MKTTNQLIALTIVMLSLFSCNSDEPEIKKLSPPEITSFELSKTEAYPEESITITAKATNEGDGALTYKYSTNKGTLKTSEDPKVATLKLPRTHGEVLITLDVNNTQDSIRDIKTVEVLPVRFYDTFISASQSWSAYNVTYKFENEKVSLAKANVPDKTYGYLAYELQNPSSSSFKGFKTRISMDGVENTEDFPILRSDFLKDPNKTSGTVVISIMVMIYPAVEADQQNWKVRAYLLDVKDNTTTYLDLPIENKNKYIDAIASKDMLTVELGYTESSEITVHFNDQEVLNSTDLNSYMIANKVTCTNYLHRYFYFLNNNIKLDVDYIYLPE